MSRPFLVDGRRRFLFPAFFLVAVTFLSFLPSLRNGFVNWDDTYWLIKNPLVRQCSLSAIGDLFTSPYLSEKSLSWPVILSYMLEYRFFGLNPFVYHLTNLTLHLLNTLLTFWLVTVLSRDIRIGFGVAFLFGVHPLHVESVAWVTERKDMMSALFFLSSVTSYVYYALKRKPRAFYFLSLLFFILSVISKAIGIGLPLVLLSVDALRGRKPDKKMFLEKIPFFIIALYIGLNGLCNQSLQVSAVQPLWHRYPIYVTYGVLFYLGKIFWPAHLAVVYPAPPVSGELLLRLFLGTLSVIAVWACFWKHLKDFRGLLLFGIFFFVILLIPTFELMPYNPSIVFDRYSYLSSIGIFLVVCILFVRIYENMGSAGFLKVIFFGGLITAGMFLSVLTWQRSLVWKNSLTLWNDQVKKYPAFAQSYIYRGNTYNLMGNYTKAIEDYSRAIGLQPGHLEAIVRRGSAFIRKGDYPQAIANFDLLLLQQPSGYFATLARERRKQAYRLHSKIKNHRNS